MLSRRPRDRDYDLGLWLSESLVSHGRQARLAMLGELRSVIARFEARLPTATLTDTTRPSATD